MICIFQPGYEARLKTIEKDLISLFPAYESVKINRRVSFYDTFDWRLYDQGYRLFIHGKKMYLESVQDVHLNLSIPVKQSPRYVTHIRSETFRDILRPIVEVRALLLVLKLTICGIRFRLLNNEKKTILYCMIETPSVESEGGTLSLATSVSLTPVKGYDNAFNKAKKWCLKEGFTQIQSDLLTRALQSAGKRPGEYSSRVQLKLDPAMPAAQATQKILAQLLRTMQLNETGLIDDIDIEFLHDFRVSIRRIRSLFGQLKIVFSPEIVKKARKDFAEIGRLTNKMRDIDVYLLREASYLAMLPPDMQSDINPFFSRLKIDRTTEHSRIVEYITGDFYKRLMQEWISFSTAPIGQVASIPGKKPVYGFAQKVILKRYRKIINLGKSIDPHTGDEVLHQLRIECKKLRYLLEFFISLFPKRKMNILIRHLKKLQDNLGHYNDLSVQQNKLREYAVSVQPDHSKHHSVAAGVLIGRLFNEYQQVRVQISDSIIQFSSPAVMNLFDELFSDKTESRS
jgi:CHAD domain-containing protein